MKGRIKIQDGGNTYISDELRDEGFIGEVAFLANAATVTLLKPGVSLDDVKRSLKVILQDIELRKSLEENEGKKSRK